MTFINDRHTLYVGWVLGVGLRHGIPLTPVRDDAGNYTDMLAIPFGNINVTVVIPPPPDDWEIP